MHIQKQTDIKDIVASIVAECEALSPRNTPKMRQIRQKYTQLLKDQDDVFVCTLAGELCQICGYRWFGYELLRNHPASFIRLGAAELEDLAQGMDSWWTVDSFARTLSGPAWLAGQVQDELFVRWAHSDDRWWRRAALVSTVALNVRSQGGKGNARRTLIICQELAADPDDMVVKALSWALRELVVHDRMQVQGFLEKNDAVLAARVRREVSNKLGTGLKNPKGVTDGA
jgi:3-methyladenine DNA glycosylase AlkD